MRRAPPRRGLPRAGPPRGGPSRGRPQKEGLLIRRGPPRRGPPRRELHTGGPPKRKRGQPASWKKDVEAFVWNAETLAPRQGSLKRGGSTYGMAVGTFVKDTFEYFADVLWRLSPSTRKLAFPFVIKAIQTAKAKRLLQMKKLVVSAPC